MISPACGGRAEIKNSWIDREARRGEVMDRPDALIVLAPLENHGIKTVCTEDLHRGIRLEGRQGCPDRHGVPQPLKHDARGIMGILEPIVQR